MFRLTPVVRNIIIICVVLFIIEAIRLFPLSYYMALYKIGTGQFRPYQLFTYMFAHGSFGHVFFNMLTLAFMGPTLEMVWGFKRFLSFYLITGIGAAVIYMLIEFFLNPLSGGVMVGASGAIYGMLTAFGMLYPDMQIQLLIPPIPIKAKYLVIFTGVLTFVMDRSGQVAHFAHLGGAIIGFILVRTGRF
jgi:membrane associated rhomboid family serine protease